VADAGFPGIAVVLGEAFETVEVRGSDVVAGGAAALPVSPGARRRPASPASSGPSASPGSVGGGVRMNAGGHGSDIAASLRSIRAFDSGPGSMGR
jgi:UDP-N-acetylmuramate dehydrogenase